MTLHEFRPVHPTHRPALVRFVASGLLATVESALHGGLPLPRLARELAARTEVLAGLRPPSRILTRLRWLHREVSRLAALDDSRAEPTAERAQLVAALEAVRDSLVTLLKPSPLDPTGAASPARSSTRIAATVTSARTAVAG